MNSDLFEKHLALALRLSTAILKNGAETYRAEECALSILSAGGGNDIEILALPTAITVSAEYMGHSYTKVSSIKSRINNLGNIDSLNTISREVSAGRMEPAEALKKVDCIEKTQNKFPKRIPFASVSSAAFAVMFNGGVAEFFLAFIVVFLAQTVIYILKSKGIIAFFSNMSGSVVTAVLARFCLILFPDINISAIIIGGIMPLLPGLVMLNAIRDTLYGDIISGTARGVEAMLSAIAIAAGVGLVLAI